jgi:hypothetical protein
MIALLCAPEPDRARHLLYMAKPALWPVWPFLPLSRRKHGTAEEELGLLYDSPASTVPFGPAVTVHLANLFLLPRTEVEFLALPKEQYDSPEDAFESGWRVD